jgi:hypothetical protein
MPRSESAGASLRTLRPTTCEMGRCKSGSPLSAACGSSGIGGTTDGKQNVRLSGTPEGVHPKSVRVCFGAAGAVGLPGAPGDA